ASTLFCRSPFIAYEVTATTGMSRRSGSALNSRVSCKPSMSGSWMSISTRRGRTARTLALAVFASPAVCTSYPFFSRSQRNSFKFISLSSTMRMDSLAIARLPSHFDACCWQEGVQLPEQGHRAVAALRDHGVRRLAQARAILRRECFHRPDDHARTTRFIRPRAASVEVDSHDPEPAEHTHQ